MVIELDPGNSEQTIHDKDTRFFAAPPLHYQLGHRFPSNNMLIFNWFVTLHDLGIAAVRRERLQHDDNIHMDGRSKVSHILKRLKHTWITSLLRTTYRFCFESSLELRRMDSLGDYS